MNVLFHAVAVVIHCYLYGVSNLTGGNSHEQILLYPGQDSCHRKDTEQ